MDKAIVGGTVITGCYGMSQGQTTAQMLVYLFWAVVAVAFVLIVMVSWHIGLEIYRCRIKKKRLKRIESIRGSGHGQPV